LNINSIHEVILTYTQKELDDYLAYRISLIHEKTAKWHRKAHKIFWASTYGEISRVSLDRLRTQVLREYRSRDSWGKVFYFVKSFLDYMARVRFDFRYKNYTVFLDKPKTLREIKVLTPRLVMVEDIRNVITRIKESPFLKDSEKQDYITQILFLAYSGQRVVTESRLRVEQFKLALSQNPPVLTIEPQQDKIRMEHYVPIHPVLIEPLTEHIGKRHNAELMFNYNGLMRWLGKARIPMSRCKGWFQLKDERKWFEQKSDEIGFLDANKNFIMSHGVSSVNWRSYKQFLPETVYNNYMEKWGGIMIEYN